MNEKIERPCKKLGYCPYGPLVEQFPLHEEEMKRANELGILQPDGTPDLNEYIKKYGYAEKSCTIFGHECPIYYVKEDFVDE